MKLSGLALPVTFPPKHLIRTQNLKIEVADMGKAVKPVLCHMTGGNQYWMFRTDGKILRDFLCIGRQVAPNFFPPLTRGTSIHTIFNIRTVQWSPVNLMFWNLSEETLSRLEKTEGRKLQWCRATTASPGVTTTRTTSSPSRRPAPASHFAGWTTLRMKSVWQSAIPFLSFSSGTSPITIPEAWRTGTWHRCSVWKCYMLCILRLKSVNSHIYNFL